MPSADQVPVNSTHSTMRWPEWVVLIAGSTGSALRAVHPFQPSHHAGCPTRSLSRRECDGFLVALAPGHHCPSHSGHLVGKRDGSNLGGPPRQQRRKPRPMLGTVERRIADHGERTGCEQAAQISAESMTARSLSDVARFSVKALGPRLTCRLSSNDLVTSTLSIARDIEFAIAYPKSRSPFEVASSSASTHL